MCAALRLFIFVACVPILITACGGSSGNDNVTTDTAATTTTTSNNPPQVSAVDDISITSSANQTISVTATDSDGDSLSYAWSQSSEVSDVLVLAQADTATVTITAPSVTSDTAFTVTVDVSDGSVTTTTSFVLTVTPLSDQTVSVGELFPMGLMASSPFAEAPSNAPTRHRFIRTNGQRRSLGGSAGPAVPHYTWATEEIDAVLAGSTPLTSVFDINSFYRNTMNANCFAPSISYSDHPDASGGTPTSGQLPGGDLGIWLATSSDGNACVVSQTNQLLAAVQDQSLMSLMTIASMVSALNSTGISLPPAMSSVSALSAMLALGVADVVFTQAFITNNGSSWTYQLAFDYTVSGKVYQSEITMDHTPGASATEYNGNLYYTVEGEDGVSVINLPGRNCSVNERTRAGSLTYVRDNDAMNLQARTATLCGHGVSNAFNSNNLVDVDNRYNAATNPDGWSENFSIFGADFDITNIVGEYTFVWQAGMNDGNSRILTIGFNDTSLDNGEGHFGYGGTIDDSDGWIQGFICNWAAPGGSRTMIDKTQRQFFEYDTATAVYLGDAHRANIEFAPTASCDYDGSGDFLFDIDASGSLSEEETARDAAVAAGDVYDFVSDLWTPPDASLTVKENLQARGIRVPNVPQNWPADE